VRRFVIIGRTAHASEGVLLDDLPGTSGRLDVLVRCVRAALLVSHGLRRDVIVYLVLLGFESPRTVRIDGRSAKFIRPDERPLATLLKKTLALVVSEAAAFAELKPGVAVACAGLEAVLGDLAGATPFVLEERGADVRAIGDELAEDAVFFIGDHLGFDEETRARLAALGARPVSVGPVSLHSDDVVTVLSNEIDRRAGPPSSGAS
jgi:tRNA (pseudouridine54-N1)-methyltransferase